MSLLAAAGLAVALTDPGPAWAGGGREDDEVSKDTIATCGEIGIDPNGCIAFFGDDGTIAVSDNTDGFAAGKKVFVSGTLDFTSFPCAPVRLPELQVSFIGHCADYCGEISIGPLGCPQLMLDDGSVLFVNDDKGFPAGSRVHIVGAQVIDFLCPPATLGIGIVQPVITSAIGDLNCDDSTGPDDLAQLLANWGECAPFAPCPADFDNDGAVGPGDLADLLATWD
jgi:hypothetical protein